jgi:methyltransferase-like protein/2-polyprenyl-3-methyl-5-hydroxy-6-metoxy-1,4-benzoquinol methylase
MNEIIDKLRADYDAVIYEAWEHIHAHPDRIAVVAALRGLTPPPVSNCRVLEIACATGGHLLPMAEQMPGSRFVGIDLSPRQIESGAAIIRELGLTNIELRCQDLMDFPEDAGEFDYIIAHGFYSWVPEPVQRKLMNVCQRHLTKNGLAYISYNTLPGWGAKGVIRDMMLYHSRGVTDLGERVRRGREMVQFVAENISYGSFYRNLTGDFQKSMPDEADSYLLHEHLTAVNEALYLREFVSRTGAYDLSLVGDANAKDDYWTRISSVARETILKLSANSVERDQYMDFLTNRMFRRSILCRAEAANFTQESAARQIRKLYIAGNPSETSAGVNAAGRTVIEFGTKDDKVQLSDPRPIAAMRRLCRAWPSALPFSELAAASLAEVPASQRNPEKNADAMAHVIETCHTLGIVELWTRPTDHIAAAPGEKPLVTRWARWQAAKLPTITSLRHVRMNTEPSLRQLLPLLDGTRNRDALAAELTKRNAEAAPKFDQAIDLILQQLAAASLILNQ